MEGMPGMEIGGAGCAKDEDICHGDEQEGVVW